MLIHIIDMVWIESTTKLKGCDIVTHQKCRFQLTFIECPLPAKHLLL